MQNQAPAQPDAESVEDDDVEQEGAAAADADGGGDPAQADEGEEADIDGDGAQEGAAPMPGGEANAGGTAAVGWGETLRTAIEDTDTAEVFEPLAEVLATIYGVKKLTEAFLVHHRVRVGSSSGTIVTLGLPRGEARPDACYFFAVELTAAAAAAGTSP